MTVLVVPTIGAYHVLPTTPNAEISCAPLGTVGAAPLFHWLNVKVVVAGPIPESCISIGYGVPEAAI